MWLIKLETANISLKLPFIMCGGAEGFKSICSCFDHIKSTTVFYSSMTRSIWILSSRAHFRMLHCIKNIFEKSLSFEIFLSHVS